MQKTCGAKTRSGKPCANNKVMANGRCRMHGGGSTGPKDIEAVKGNQNARKHGIYSDTYTEEEVELLEQDEISSIDEEIKVLKIQLRRCLTYHEPRPDLAEKLAGRIASMVKTRKELMQDIEVDEFDEPDEAFL